MPLSYTPNFTARALGHACRAGGCLHSSRQLRGVQWHVQPGDGRVQLLHHAQRPRLQAASASCVHGIRCDASADVLAAPRHARRVAEAQATLGAERDRRAALRVHTADAAAGGAVPIQVGRRPVSLPVQCRHASADAAGAGARRVAQPDRDLQRGCTHLQILHESHRARSRGGGYERAAAGAASPERAVPRGVRWHGLVRPAAATCPPCRTGGPIVLVLPRGRANPAGRLRAR